MTETCCPGELKGIFIVSTNYFYLDFCHYCGRTASYPTAPAQIPACGFFAPGSSDSLASAILHLSAIPCGEVCLAIPALHVRTRFPMQAATACQPLPRVNGFPVSEYCGLIRPPKAIGSPTCCFGSAYLFRPLRIYNPSKQPSQEPFGSPKFLTLLSTHATL